MRIRKLGDHKFKVVLFQGSPRDKDTCPNMDSKSHDIVDHIVDKWGNFIDFEVVDLAVNQSKAPTIQPCKGCISTAGGFHCHFGTSPGSMGCSCYFRGDKKKPDLLHEQLVYEKLSNCDAFVIISPIHWFSLTSQVKLLFDRLVCINQTLTVDEATELMGKGNIKNSEITGEFAKSGKYNHLLKNHLEGKYAAFLIHGDDGANDYEGKETPESMSDFKDLPLERVADPFVQQCKYSGIFVPDDLVQAVYVNKGVDYYSANFESKGEILTKSDSLMENLLTHLENK